MKVIMMLADHAQVADGKLFISGGRWTVTGPGPVPFAIAIYIEVPWDRTNTKHTWRLELLDADGEPVTIETPDGTQPISADGEFEVGRPPGMKPGTPVAPRVEAELPGSARQDGHLARWLCVHQLSDERNRTFTRRVVYDGRTYVCRR